MFAVQPPYIICYSRADAVALIGFTQSKRRNQLANCCHTLYRFSIGHPVVARAWFYDDGVVTANFQRIRNHWQQQCQHLCRTDALCGSVDGVQCDCRRYSRFIFSQPSPERQHQGRRQSGFSKPVS